MGTHISRVKSVDLDSWTDEQMASIISWGNARANKYWEAKLATGHAPSEAKIENFIRTKYELKRWAMDPERPDPSTLGDEGDDEVPVSVVKEQKPVAATRTAPSANVQPRRAAPPVADLIGGDDGPPARSNTAGPQSRIPPKADPVPPKQTSTKDSLLGLDFLGGGNPAPPRPASTPGVATPGGQTRPDLKQSILSLYASVPKPQPQQQQPNQQQSQWGGMQPPGTHQQQGSMGGFNDAFGGLSMSSNTSPKPAADPFASLGGGNRTSQNMSQGGFGGLSGGSFFDAKPAQPTHQKQPSNSGWGSFTSPTQSKPVASPPPQPSSSAMGDLFDLSSPTTTTTTTSPPPVTNPTPPAAQSSSVFNLSQPKQQPLQSPPAQASTGGFGGMQSGADVWGSNEWSTPAATTTQKSVSPGFSSAQSTSNTNDFNWGGSSATGGSFASTPIVPGQSGGFAPAAPKVAADEEFGGWTGASPTTNTNTNTNTTSSGGQKKSGFGGDDDLFSNVWG